MDFTIQSFMLNYTAEVFFFSLFPICYLKGFVLCSLEACSWDQ